MIRYRLIDKYNAPTEGTRYITNQRTSTSSAKVDPTQNERGTLRGSDYPSMRGAPKCPYQPAPEDNPEPANAAFSPKDNSLIMKQIMSAPERGRR